MWCVHRVEDVVLGVHQCTRAMISCWQCDAKPRKHHLWSVSFSNHKRLKLHMCIWWNLLKNKMGEGWGREKKNLSWCLPHCWLVKCLQLVVREASWVEMHLSICSSSLWPHILVTGLSTCWQQGEGQHERQLWWQQWPELSSSDSAPENYSGDSLGFQSMSYH